MENDNAPRQIKTVSPLREFPYPGGIPNWLKAELSRREEWSRIPKNAWLRVTSGMGGGRVLMGIGQDLDVWDPSGSTNATHPDFTTQTELPPVGITGMTLQPKSREIGTMDQCTFNWQVPSIKEFMEFAPYFLNPGASVLVEFGWGESRSVEQAVELLPSEMVKLFNASTREDELNKRIESSGGTYYAVPGMIVNFDFSLNDDGSYNCSTKLISAGQIMTGAHVGHHVQERGVNNDTGPNHKRKTRLFEFFAERLDEYIDGGITGTGEGPSDDISSKIGYDRIKEETISIELDPGSQTEDGSNYKYITWDHFEHIVNFFLGYKVTYSNSETNSKEFFCKMDSSNSYLKYHEWLRALDTSQVIIPNPRASDTTSIANSHDTRFTVQTDTGHKVFRLGGLWLSAGLIRQSFADAPTLHDALHLITSEIGRQSHEFWNLKVYVDSIKDTLRIVDLNSTVSSLDSLIDSDEIFVIPSVGERSIVRSSSVTSDLSNDTIVSVLFSQRDPNRLHNDSTDVQHGVFWYGLKDSIKTFEPMPYIEEDEHQNERPADTANATLATIPGGYWPPTSGGRRASSPPGEAAALAQVDSLRQRVARSSKIDPLNASNEDVRRLKDEIDPPTTEMGNRDMLTNLRFKVTLDGISGFRMGDAIAMENIPPEYREMGVFQVMSVEHSVDGADWNTTLSGRFRTGSIKKIESALDKYRGTDLQERRNAWEEQLVPYTNDDPPYAWSQLNSRMGISPGTAFGGGLGGYEIRSTGGSPTQSIPIRSSNELLPHHGGTSYQHGTSPVTGQPATYTTSGKFVIDYTMTKDGTVSVPIPAPSSGTAHFTEGAEDSRGGNTVVFVDSDGDRWVFCHLASLAGSGAVSMSRGQSLGIQGNTGRSTGTHVHLQCTSEVKVRRYIDDLLTARSQNFVVGPNADANDTVWLARCLLSESGSVTKEYPYIAWIVRNRVVTGYRGKSTYQEVIEDPGQFSAFNDNSPEFRNITANQTTGFPKGHTLATWREAMRVANTIINAPKSNNIFLTGSTGMTTNNRGDIFQVTPIFSTHDAEKVRHFFAPRSMRPGRYTTEVMAVENYGYTTVPSWYEREKEVVTPVTGERLRIFKDIA